MTALLSSVTLAQELPDHFKKLPVEFRQVASGKSLLRDENDRTNAIVIWNEEGLKALLEKYPERLHDLKPVFDGKHVFIMALSDEITACFCDGVSQAMIPNAVSYYIDLRDSGLRFKRLAPPEGKKYSSWVVVRMERPEGITTVRVREPVAGGLTLHLGEK